MVCVKSLLLVVLVAAPGIFAATIPAAVELAGRDSADVARADFDFDIVWAPEVTPRDASPGEQVKAELSARQSQYCDSNTATYAAETASSSVGDCRYIGDIMASLGFVFPARPGSWLTVMTRYTCGFAIQGLDEQEVAVHGRNMAHFTDQIINRFQQPNGRVNGRGEVLCKTYDGLSTYRAAFKLFST